MQNPATHLRSGTFFKNIRLFQRLSLFFTALAGAAVTGTAASAATATVLSAFHDRNDCGDERRDYDRKQYIINNVHMCLPSAGSCRFQAKRSIMPCIPNAATHATAHWKITIPSVRSADVSLLKAPIAAMQGV